jgi:hypothetical protein
MTRMWEVACTAETGNIQASHISERNNSVHLEWNILCTFLPIINRLCLAIVHTGGQAILVVLIMAEDKSFVTDIYILQTSVELLRYLTLIFISTLHLSQVLHKTLLKYLISN